MTIVAYENINVNKFFTVPYVMRSVLWYYDELPIISIVTQTQWLILLKEQSKYKQYNLIHQWYVIG